MYGTVLQDWVTIRGGSTITSIAQSEQAWQSFQTSEDIVLWLDCREVSGTFTSMTMYFETAPAKDESLFVAMVTAGSTMTASTTPVNVKVLVSQNPAVPLARWVRWRIAVVAPSTAWDATFRILCATSGPPG